MIIPESETLWMDAVVFAQRTTENKATSESGRKPSGKNERFDKKHVSKISAWAWKELGSKSVQAWLPFMNKWHDNLYESANLQSKSEHGYKCTYF